MAGGSANFGAVSGDVTTTAKLLKVGNARRKNIIIQNTHASNSLYLGSDDTVVAGSGLRLLPGESYRFEDYTGPIYGIASGAATTVIYFEVV